MPLKQISQVPGKLRPVQKNWLLPARVAWIVVLCLILWLMVYSLPFADLNLRFDQIISDSYNLFGQRIGLSAFLRKLVAVQYVISLFYIGVGCVIFFRKPADRIALLTSLGLIGLPYVTYFSGIVDQTNPGGIFGKLLFVAEGTASLVSGIAIMLLLLVFPDGRIAPAWVSRTIRFFLIPVILVVGLFGFGDALLNTPWGLVMLGDLGWQIGSFFIILLTFLGIFSQVYKFYRISTLLQRQQTKWVFFSLILALFWIVFNLADLVRGLSFQLRGYFALFVVVMNLMIFGFVPLAFAVSIFRYRLYDIDLIVRRTLQYGLLTGLLAGFYFLIIVMLQAVLTPLTGQEASTIVIVVSTLSIAALFNPLRKRIQAFIDRRFFRSKYDAERILAEFGAAMRAEVDLEHLSSAMVGIVQRTVQPETVSLWLSPEKLAKGKLEP